MSQVAATDFIDVIINPNGSLVKQFDNCFERQRRCQEKIFYKLFFSGLQSQTQDIDTFASRSDVDFMTLDDTVKTLGHLETTTGTTAIRNLNGTSNPLNGTGVGIVVVDSGIDQNHQAFLDNGWKFPNCLFAGFYRSKPHR